MKSDDLNHAARALAAVKYGEPIALQGLSVEEEIGFLFLAAVGRKLIKGYGG